MRGGVAVQGDHSWDAMLPRRPGKEPLGGCDIPPSAQEKIDGAARFIHGAIQVDPLTFDLEVSLNLRATSRRPAVRTGSSASQIPARNAAPIARWVV